MPTTWAGVPGTSFRSAGEGASACEGWRAAGRGGGQSVRVPFVSDTGRAGKRGAHRQWASPVPRAGGLPDGDLLGGAQRPRPLRYGRDGQA